MTKKSSAVRGGSGLDDTTFIKTGLQLLIQLGHMSSSKHWDPTRQTMANNAYSSPRRINRSMIDVPLSPHNHLNLTRMSWNGWPTWMSRKACLFWQAEGGQSFFVLVSQPNQDVLEQLADLDFQEHLLTSASRGPLNLTRMSRNGQPTWMSREVCSLQ